ncbi:MAG: hypothetical protein OXU70_02180 [Gammaproteobacteria bacterium]|nr:hypothetical protein [Gammaproteobacteria bacterium]
MEANVFDINLLGMEKNMQLVVTGGSSGVGAALVSRLAAAGHSIVNLDVQAPTESVKGCDYRPLDLSDAAAIGAEVEFIAYDMSGHGPSDLPNSMDYWQRAVEWIGFYFDRASEASIGVH